MLERLALTVETGMALTVETGTDSLALTVETGTSQSQYSMTAIFKTDATPTTGIIPGASISENIRNGLKYLCTNFGAFITKCTICHCAVAMPPHYN